MTAFIAIAGAVWLFVMYGAFALCRAASKGDRQLKAALRDRHLRNLP